MKKRKIYIAGCGGMLGEAFHQVFSKDFELKCTDIDLNSEWLSFLDFRDLDSYMRDVVNTKPDFLFHLGAFTDLEYCEKNTDETYRTNILAVENAVYVANQ
jgi:dTDP-4-dehydrorhamnose reductase